MNAPTQTIPDTETVSSTWLAQMRREYLEYARQRDLLSSAIFDAARKAGVINGEVPLDGPQLLMALDDLVGCVQRSEAEVERFKAANADLSRLNEMRRNHLGNAKKAAGIGPGEDLVSAIEALQVRAVPMSMVAASVNDIPDFSPGSGNKARRRAAALGIKLDANCRPFDARKPWREIAEPVSDADRLCHESGCWLCEGTGRDPDGTICKMNDAIPF